VQRARIRVVAEAEEHGLVPEVLSNQGQLIAVGLIPDHHLLYAAALGHLENVKRFGQGKRHHVRSHAVDHGLPVFGIGG
jgi:hypothetical protein